VKQLKKLKLNVNVLKKKKKLHVYVRNKNVLEIYKLIKMLYERNVNKKDVNVNGEKKKNLKP
jgi:hypothetical protein